MAKYTELDIEQARLIIRNSAYENEVIAALDILGALKVVDAVPDMMRHISDERPTVKLALESALLAMGQDAIPPIVEYLPQLDPEHHVSLQSLVESYWKDAGADRIRQMVKHEDNRVRWAIAWTLATPLQTIPPEDIGYIFEGLADESLTSIRWAATQSLTTLAYTSKNIPAELIKVALPVMVDNFKYGDLNLSESSVQAIALLTTPPNPAITAMLTSSDAELQVAAVKVLTAWVQNDTELDRGTLDALKTAMQHPGWQMENAVIHLRYVLSISYPQALKILEGVPNTGQLREVVEPKQDVRSTGEIMLPPMDDISPVNAEEPKNNQNEK